MTRLFRSRPGGLVEFNPTRPGPFFDSEEKDEEDEEEEEDDEEEEQEITDGDDSIQNPMSTPFISPGSRFGTRRGKDRSQSSGSGQSPFPILDVLVAVLRKSLVTCSVERDDVVSMDIGWPTEVRHVSHVTFDRFDGFLGLPRELEPEFPTKPPSASASVFGVSAKSMQCSYDSRGNSVPTILLMMQKRLYAEGGLKAEGIFRINPDNGQEEYVRQQLNRGVVLRGIDVHCLAGLIKAWFRELPTGVLDSLTPEQVMHCNSEEDCTELVNSLPPTEAALLDWATSLMADVVEHEQYNKMNARNIAMVFAPNMTQMADPLTALIHAVQVMNFLKTLILKNLRERDQVAAKSRLLSSCFSSPERINSDALTREKPHEPKFLRNTTLSRLEAENADKSCKGREMSDLGDGGALSSSLRECGETTGMESGYECGERSVSLREGVRRLCRHPVFQLSRPAKKTRDVSVVDTSGEGGEAWV